MNLLTIALTLATSFPGDLPDRPPRFSQRPAPLPARILDPSPSAPTFSPYGLQNPPGQAQEGVRPAVLSPYGMIRYDQLPTVKPIPPASRPRMLPAIPVSRPTSKPGAPAPVTLPPDDLIPPPMPTVPFLKS
jgi:hypothetical protein